MYRVFKGMRIIPGTTDDSIERGLLVVEDDTILALGEEGRVNIPSDATVYNLQGKTLLPGFIDAHTHILLDASRDPMGALVHESPTYSTIKAINSLEKTLLSGVTTIRDLGGLDYIDLELARAVEEGLIPGPSILAAGKLITMTGGHGHFIGREADGRSDVRRAAREQLKAGAHVIKVMATGGILTEGVEPGASQLTKEEMEAAIEEAHKAGKKTATHAQGREGIENAILAGIDSIEHGFFLDEDLVELMVERDVFLVPTLSATHWVVASGLAKGIPAYVVEKTEKVISHHRESFVRAMEAGVKIAMGTDAGTPFNSHGQNLQELKLMVEAGMDPIDAILCGTSSSAQLLGIQDEKGTLEEGKRADMVLLNGDPLEDIEALFAVEEVYKSGRPCRGNTMSG